MNILSHKPRGGKRYTFNRIVAFLITGLAAPSVFYFFWIGALNYAYLTLAVTIPSLAALVSNYTWNETRRPHEYGDIVIQQGGPNVVQSKENNTAVGHIQASPFKERG